MYWTKQNQNKQPKQNSKTKKQSTGFNLYSIPWVWIMNNFGFIGIIFHFLKKKQNK